MPFSATVFTTAESSGWFHTYLVCLWLQPEPVALFDVKTYPRIEEYYELHVCTVLVGGSLCADLGVPSDQPPVRPATASVQTPRGGWSVVAELGAWRLPSRSLSLNYWEIYSKDRPQEADGIDSVIVVDNVPQVGPDHLKKLKNVIHKIFSKYIFLEYASPAHASDAVKNADGYKLDKQHTFRVNLFTDFDK
ncbi:hypothetical protein MC885_019640 [Smutsia gigantea]|nr:hypothetical protein MC885_019640 [Smutsia gigantea]